MTLRHIAPDVRFRSAATRLRIAALRWLLSGAAALALNANANVVVTGASVSGVEGSLFNDTVATFTTNDANPTPAAYSATVNWGDGTLSLGTVFAVVGGFGVSGAHTYANEGAYLMSITVNDSIDATQASAPNAFYVRDASLAARGIYFGSYAGVLFSGTVATFSDGNAFALASDFSASIDWDDGTISLGIITSLPSGGYAVSGSHTYTQTGLKTKTVIVTIQDSGGSSATAISRTGDRIFANGFGG